MLDIKRQYCDVILEQIDKNYDAQHEKIVKIGHEFTECMINGGVVQLFGDKLCEEFVNELFFRAGGIVGFHANRAKEAALAGKLDPKSVADSSYLNDPSSIDKILSIYEMNAKDMWVIISINGNEPAVIELAKKVKAQGYHLVAVTNLSSYKANKGTLLDFADEYLDFGSEDPDLTIQIGNEKYGQWSTTIGSVIAQEIMAEVYATFVEKGIEAPVLLSANINGADVHNNNLVAQYGGRRIR